MVLLDTLASEHSSPLAPVSDSDRIDFGGKKLAKISTRQFGGKKSEIEIDNRLVSD